MKNTNTVILQLLFFKGMAILLLKEMAHTDLLLLEILSCSGNIECSSRKSYRAAPVVQCPSYISRRHDACDCVIHQLLGRNGVASSRPNKLINQAGWGVGGRRTQQRISLSYFTALLISTFIDDVYSHSVRGYYCFLYMQGRRLCIQHVHCNTEQL